MNHNRTSRNGSKRNQIKTSSALPASDCQADQKVTRMKHRGLKSARAGQASIELVAMTAVMVPFVAIVVFTGLQVCKQVYLTATNALSWPFM